MSWDGCGEKGHNNKRSVAAVRVRRTRRPGHGEGEPPRVHAEVGGIEKEDVPHHDHHPEEAADEQPPDGRVRPVSGLVDAPGAVPEPRETVGERGLVDPLGVVDELHDPRGVARGRVANPRLAGRHPFEESLTRRTVHARDGEVGDLAGGLVRGRGRRLGLARAPFRLVGVSGSTPLGRPEGPIDLEAAATAVDPVDALVGHGRVGRRQTAEVARVGHARGWKNGTGTIGRSYPAARRPIDRGR